jgi:hypothetical protein
LEDKRKIFANQMKTAKILAWWIMHYMIPRYEAGFFYILFISLVYISCNQRRIAYFICNRDFIS